MIPPLVYSGFLRQWELGTTGNGGIHKLFQPLGRHGLIPHFVVNPRSCDPGHDVATVFL